MIKILTIVGARPQFVKASAISRAIRENYSKKINEVIVHTGQHYDDNMSTLFFNDLDIPIPKYNLGISGGNHGFMTGNMIIEIEKVLLSEKPNLVLLYGDTNSTLAGAISASKLNIKIAHVEAGLRSFNMEMPEELNRILTDRVSSFLFCPTKSSVLNLKNEGIEKGVFNVGDVMLDVATHVKNLSRNQSNFKNNIGLLNSNYILVTCHRAENTNNTEKLIQILKSLDQLSKDFKIVFPIHPRTSKIIDNKNLNHLLKNLIIIEPLSYTEMIDFLSNAILIITDSGGLQKEAFFCETPCLTIREETEWTETVEIGANVLVKAESKHILNGVNKVLKTKNNIVFKHNPYGDGSSASLILEKILTNL